jgi:hypothetical protein
MKKWKYITYLYNLLQRHFPSSQIEALEMPVVPAVSLANQLKLFLRFLLSDVIKHIKNNLTFLSCKHLPLRQLKKPGLVMYSNTHSVLP